MLVGLLATLLRWVRQVTSAKDAAAALEMILEEAEASGSHQPSLPESDCVAILTAALERANFDLGLSIYHAMATATLAGAVVWAGRGYAPTLGLAATHHQDSAGARAGAVSRAACQ